MPSRGEWQFLRERAVTSLHFISMQAIGALVIHSLLFPILVYGSLSPFCTITIQVFIYSTRTRRFSPFHQTKRFNIIYIIIYIILI